MKLNKSQIVGITGTAALTSVTVADVVSGGDGSIGILLIMWLVGWAVNT